MVDGDGRTMEMEYVKNGTYTYRTSPLRKRSRSLTESFDGVMEDVDGMVVDERCIGNLPGRERMGAPNMGMEARTI